MTGQRRLLAIILVLLVVCGFTALIVPAAAGLFLLANRTTDAAPIPTAVARVITVPVEPATTPRAAVSRATGGELRLPGALPPTLDPALSTDSTSAQYIVEIFSGLVTADPDLELIPDIAESYELSEDGRLYTFHLRPNVRFHDGRAVTAEDVKFSLERSCSPSTGSQVAFTYLGDIVGAREMLTGQADSLAGVTVVDDLTITIEIDAPRPAFLAKLSHPVAFVVDRESITSRDPLRRANGTGPFRLAEVVPGNRIVLAANNDYYREPKPALARVIFRLSAGHAVTMYENNELDASPVGVSDLPRITDPESASSRELTISEQLATFYVGINSNIEPFTDIRVRQAFAHAIDRERIVEFLYEGTVRAADTIVPPDMPEYDNAALGAPAYDVALARDLLARSSYGGADGLPPVTIHVSSGGPYTDPVADAIAYLLEENLGVSVTIRQSDWSTFLDQLAKPENPFQMYILGWIADYPDPENFLNVLFSSTSTDNHSHYANPRVDELLRQAGLEMDVEKRHELYLEAESIILAEAPVLPLYHDVEYWLTKPYVRDLYYPAMIVPRFQYAHISR